MSSTFNISWKSEGRATYWALVVVGALVNMSLVLSILFNCASPKAINSGILDVRSDLFSQLATAVCSSAFVDIAIYAVALLDFLPFFLFVDLLTILRFLRLFVPPLSRDFL